MSAAIAANCDCDYHSGGCSISTPAPKGFKCKCIYKGAWTCSGVAFPCSDSESCPGGMTNYCACKQGGGDCGAYTSKSKCKNNKKGLPKTDSKASCDCDYHKGGCLISSPAPKDYKCSCVYTGGWTCRGWAQGCHKSEYCGGEDSTYCACLQGGGDCGAYPKSSRESCDLKKLTAKSCNCKDTSQWSKGQFTLEKTAYQFKKVTYSKQPPTELASVTSPNNSDLDNPWEYTKSTVQRRKSHFKQTSGLKITAGTSLKVEIPTIAEGSISLSTEVHQDFEWGQEVENAFTRTRKLTCNLPKKSLTKCQVMLVESKATVPYTMVLKHKVIPDCRCESKGVWTGVGAYNDKMVVNVLGPCYRINATGDCY